MIGQCGHLMWDEMEIRALGRIAGFAGSRFYCATCEAWVKIKRKATLMDILAGYDPNTRPAQSTLF